MTNIDYYNKLGTTHFGISKRRGLPVYCDELLCNDCEFDLELCDAQKMQWLRKEYTEPKKSLGDLVKDFLINYDCDKFVDTPCSECGFHEYDSDCVRLFNRIGKFIDEGIEEVTD